MNSTKTHRRMRVPRRSAVRLARAARHLSCAAVAALLALIGSRSGDVSAQAGSSLVISEIHPAGSGNGTYGADWFEVTNLGPSDVSVAGWKMDDNSNAFGTAVALRGVTTIPAGRSVVFFEGNATGTTDAAIIASFSTAWFGTATPPAGFLIGAYGGTGVGLGNGGDAVNLFDAGGTRVTGVTFGAATAAATFDNTAGLATVATVSAAGVNAAFLSANGAESGSPGIRRYASPLSAIDLSRYVRVGRFDLPEPTRSTPPDAHSLLAQEVSAVTYNWDTDSLFVVGDGGTSIVQVTKTGQLIDSMTLAPGSSAQGTEFYDPEGLTYVGAGRFVLMEERDRQAVRFVYAAGTTLTRADTQTVKLGTFAPNIGIEGISYDPLTAGFVAVKETAPQGIFQTGIDFAAGTATNGSPATEDSINLFDPALANLLDFADVFALSNLPSVSGPDASRLLVLSQESGKIVNIDRTGNISSTLTIVSDPGNPLSVPAQQHEGLTMDGSGILYVVSENGGGDFDHPQLWVYAPSLLPNQAPTAIALNNQVTAIAEGSSTSPRVKVADVAVTDDGLGTNDVTVTGPDAGSFEVDSNGLYIKAGTILDYEVKSSYSVTVAVDDATVGASPDATALFTLTVTDVVNEDPAHPSVFISEVAPWSSGNSPVGADWFEVTNTGPSAVNISGWKVDDSSAAFASALPLHGITSIAPGESVIFIETADLTAARASFLTTWFGTNPPAGLQIGSYSGGGVGLSTGGDAVNLYDAGGAVQASVSFGASPSGPSFATFDNAEAVNGAAIAQLSVAGIHGALVAANDAAEIGSPGTAGRLMVSEVAPWSSGNSPVGADWFEVTNTSARTIDITGWKVDDSSESFAAAAPLTGITTIAPGESVIFIETADVAAARIAFLTTWFGTNPPAALQIGSYTGGGIGLSTGGDAVNLYNASGVLQSGVFFGPSPAGPSFPTFDNAMGLNRTTVTQLSVSGVRGAFVAASDGNEIGSPGRTVADITGPDTVLLTTPVAVTNATTAAFVYEGTDSGAPVAGFECSLDGVPFAACATSGAIYNALGAGPHTFAVRAADHAGNVDPTPASYSWTIDTVAPILTLPSDLTVEATGPTGAVAVFILPATAADDVDGTVPAVCSGGTSGAVFPLGQTTISCASTDAAGNTAAATFHVTVVDTTAPVVDAHGDVSAAATSGSGAVVTYGIPATHDVVDGVGAALCSPASGALFPVGQTVVTCAATDAAGNTAAPVTFNVTVTAIAPATPGRMRGDGWIAVAGDASIRQRFAFNVQSRAAGEPFLRLNFWTVDRDEMPRRTNVFDATSITGVRFSDDPAFRPGWSWFWLAPAVDSVTLSGTGEFNGEPGFAFEMIATDRGEPGLGRDTFALTVKRGNTVVFATSGKLAGGNIQSLRLPNRHFAPFLSGGPQRVREVEAEGRNGTVVTYLPPTALDEDGHALAVSCTPASGHTFPLGRTWGRCSATDGAGRTGSLLFVVIVTDRTAPVFVNAPSDITVEATGPWGAEVTFPVPAAADLVDAAVTVSCTPQPGRRFRLGTTHVTCTARDDARNSVVAGFTITVRDSKAPAITLTKPINGQEYKRGSLQVVNYSCSDTASDVASCEGTRPDGALLNTIAVGTFSFTVSAEDAAGNVATKTVTYTVKAR